MSTSTWQHLLLTENKMSGSLIVHEVFKKYLFKIPKCSVNMKWTSHGTVTFLQLEHGTVTFHSQNPSGSISSQERGHVFNIRICVLNFRLCAKDTETGTVTTQVCENREVAPLGVYIIILWQGTLGSWDFEGDSVKALETLHFNAYFLSLFPWLI